MAPEQLEGREADRRADVWALGCVLYEMLTQRAPFAAEYEQAIAYGILNEDPEPVTAQRRGVSPKVDDLLAKALAKSPAGRYQHADELIVDLRSLGDKLNSTGPGVLPVDSALSANHDQGGSTNADDLTWKLRLPWAVSALMTVLFAAVSIYHFADAPLTMPDPRLRRFAVGVEQLLNANNYQRSASISPDGKYLAFVTSATSPDGGRLWVRALDELEPRQIEGTEGAAFPFWSPRGDLIGFFADQSLKTVPVSGGSVKTICEVPESVRRVRGGAWTPDEGTIVFSQYGPPWLYRVSALGGKASSLFDAGERDLDIARIHPHFVHSDVGAQVLLYTEFPRDEDRGPRIIAEDLRTGLRADLGPGIFPAFARSGHVVLQEHANSPNLWAVRFFPENLEVVGERFRVASEARGPSVASDGTLVYVQGFEANREVIWYDRRRREVRDTGLISAAIRTMTLSPDGGRIAYALGSSLGNREHWTYDLARQSRTPVFRGDSGGLITSLVWSPDGKRVALSTRESGTYDVLTQEADGSGKEQWILTTDKHEVVTDWSRDGKYLIFKTVSNSFITGADVWYLELKEDGTGWNTDPRPFLNGPFNEFEAKISPDGRYVAYVSDEPGWEEVYVERFPQGGERRTLSTNGGNHVSWGSDGTELFYIEDRTLMEVPVSTDDGFTAGTPRPAADFELGIEGSPLPYYDLSADGRQFLLQRFESQESKNGTDTIQVVQNWYEEFRDRE